MNFVDRLDTALREYGIEPLVDRSEIYAFEDWWQRIQDLIVQSDTVLFVLSHDSVASDVCRKEITFAETLNKRFAPIVAHAVDSSCVPAALSRLNFVFLDHEPTYSDGVRQLVRALGTDIEWVRRHSEYGGLALRWSRSQRSASVLLRPPQLEEAELWIAARPADAPLPTDEIRDFVLESRRLTTRRRNRVSMALAAGLVLAVALAAAAIWQKQVAMRQTEIAIESEAEARHQRDRAQKALADARIAADGLIFDLAEGLRGRGLPLVIVREVLGRAETLMVHLVEASPDDRAVRRSFAAMFGSFSQTYSLYGDIERQRGTAEKAMEIARGLMKDDASEPSSLNIMAGSLEIVGDARFQTGDLAGALAAYEEELTILRALSSQQTSPAAAHRLWQALGKIGDVRFARRDIEGAASSYDEAYLLAKRINAGEGDKPTRASRHDLAMSLWKLGDIRTEKRDHSAALAAYREAVTIDRGIAADQPSDASVLRDLAVVIGKIGDVQRLDDDLEGALQSYQDSLDIFRRVAAADPSDVDAAYNVVVGLSRVGLTLGLLGRADESCRAIQEGQGRIVSVRSRSAAPAYLRTTAGWFEERAKACSTRP